MRGKANLERPDLVAFSVELPGPLLIELEENKCCRNNCARLLLLLLLLFVAAEVELVAALFAAARESANRLLDELFGDCTDDGS